MKCLNGHSYDIARHGYLSLLGSRRVGHRGDSAEMAAARARFLAAGHYAPMAEAVAAAARQADGDRHGRPGFAVDLGAGTGYHLAAVLERLPGFVGLGLDASRPSLRHALRAHERIAGVACDVWQPLPLRDAAADLVLNVFAPRNGAEIARVLAANGALIVVSPTSRHLSQLIPRVGLLRVAEDKQQRLQAKLSPWLDAVRRSVVEFELQLTPGDVRSVVEMGPSAHHVGEGELERSLLALPDRLTVTASVIVETFQPRR